jgi:hypothetical protein
VSIVSKVEYRLCTLVGLKRDSGTTYSSIMGTLMVFSATPVIHEIDTSQRGRQYVLGPPQQVALGKKADDLECLFQVIPPEFSYYD